MRCSRRHNTVALVGSARTAGLVALTLVAGLGLTGVVMPQASAAGAKSPVSRDLVAHKAVTEGRVEPRPGRIAVGAAEIPALRTADSDTYDLGDGRLQTQTFSEPVNYDSGSGWQPIDPTLKAAAGGGWSNTAGPYTVSLPASLASPVAISTSLGSVSLQLQNGSAAGSAAGQTVTYPSALPGDSVAYSTGNYFVKESVSLASASATSTLTYAVSASAGLAQAVQGGAVLFSAGSGGFALTRPFATDANGVSGQVSLSASRSGNQLLVSMAVDPAWLSDSARAFPVVIDPSVVTFSGSSEADCYLNSGAPTVNQCPAGADMVVGHTPTAGAQRGLVRFDVSSIPASATVLSADLALSRTSTQTGSGTVGAYRLQQPWTASQTSWQTASTGTPWTPAGGDYSTTAVDSQAVTSTPGTVNFYPTQLVSQWVDGDYTNDGVELVAANESTLNALMSFASGTNTNSALWPSLTVTYVPSAYGDASYLSESSNQLNDRSTLKVDNASGNVLIDNRDVSVSGDGTPVDLDRVYNSTPSNTGQFGSGWRLSGGPDVKLDPLGDGDFDYVDPTGTYHAFMHNPAGTGWLSSAGLDADLTASGTNYTITYHASQEQLTFTQEGCSGTCAYVEVSDQTRSGANTQVSYAYTGSQLTSVTDAQGRAFRVTYNGAGYIKKITDANISPTRTWQYGYTGSKLMSYIDPDGNETDYAYNSYNRVKQITDPANESGSRPTTTLTYQPGSGAPEGQVALIDYANPAVGGGAGGGISGYQFSYTESVGSTVAAGTDNCPRTTTPYDQVVAENLTVTDVTDPQGGTTTYCGNVNNQILSTYDGVHDHRSASYSANLDPQSSSDAMATAAVYQYNYDGNSNLTSITEPANSGSTTAATSTLNYSSSGFTGAQYQPSSESDSSNDCSSADYYPSSSSTPGQLKDVYSGQTSGTGACTGTPTSTKSYTYNPDSGAANSTAPAGTIATATNGNTGVTHYAYTAHGDLAAVAQPGATLSGSSCVASTLCTGYTVDGDARLLTKTDGNSTTTTYTRDAMDRVTQINTATGACTPSAGTCVKYTYDAEGNLISRTDVTGTTTFDFDINNRMIKQHDPDTSLITQTFDGAGNLTGYSYTPPGGSPDGATYVYNAAQELTSVHDTTGTITFSEDADGRRHTVLYPNGLLITYGYTAAGKVASITPSGGTGTPPTLSYAYTTGSGSTIADHDLLQTSTSNATGTSVTSTYGYNHTANLTSVTASTGPGNYSYGHDNDGNLTTISNTTGTGGTACNAYNSADETTATYPTYSGSTCTGTAGIWNDDADGQLRTSTPAGFVLTYNSLGQTATAYHPGEATVTYGYADVGNTLRVSASVAGGGTVGYANGPLGLVSRTAAGTLAGSTSYDGTTDYTRDPSGTLLDEHGGPAGTNFYETDRQGSTVALTGTTGVGVTATYTYTPYGNSVTATGTAANDNPFRYIGGYLDAIESDAFYHLGARYYNRGGWFTQPDPSGQETDNYLYADGDPANYEDPGGQFSFDDVVSGIVGGLTGLATGIVCAGTTFGVGAVTGTCELLGVATGTAAGIATSEYYDAYDEYTDE